MPRLERPHPADEPQAIEFGQGNLRPLEPRSFVPDDDDVDRIRLDSVGAPFAAEDEVVVAPLAQPARRPVSLALSLGVLAGVIVGVGVGFWLRHDLAQMRAPAATARPGAASTAPSVAVASASSPSSAPSGSRPPEAVQRPGLNLDQLERSVETSGHNTGQGRFPPPPAVAPARPAPVQLAGRVQPPPALPSPAVALPSPTAEVAPLAAERTPPPPSPAFDSQMELANQRLNLAYDFAMAKSQDRTALHDEQEAWLSARERLTGGRESWMAMTRDRTDTLNAQAKRDRRRR